MLSQTCARRELVLSSERLDIFAGTSEGELFGKPLSLAWSELLTALLVCPVAGLLLALLVKRLRGPPPTSLGHRAARHSARLRQRKERGSVSSCFHGELMTRGSWLPRKTNGRVSQISTGRRGCLRHPQQEPAASAPSAPQRRVPQRTSRRPGHDPEKRRP